MQNELYNDYGAYEVRFAGGNSGISFGGNQMDMKGNPDYRKDFVDILLKARDQKGNSFFTEDEIKSIAGEEKKGYQKFSEGKPVKEFFGQYLSRVDAALSSGYGRQKIDELYVKEIKERTAFINNFVDNKIQPASVKEFCSTEYGKAFLFDYHNQFNIDIKKATQEDPQGASLFHYLNGRSVQFDNQPEPIAINPNTPFTLQDLKRFIFQTKEAQKQKSGVERRFENVEDCFKNFKSPKDNSHTITWDQPEFSKKPSFDSSIHMNHLKSTILSQ